MDFKDIVEEEYTANGERYRFSYLLREISDGEIFDRVNLDSLIIHLDGKRYIKNMVSLIHYYDNGTIESERYYKNGKLHREDGLAVIWYNEDGTVSSKRYFIDGEEIIDEFQIMVIDGLGMGNENNL